MARVIQLIETETVIGKGTKDNPTRILYQLWNFEGDLIFEKAEYTREDLNL